MVGKMIFGSTEGTGYQVNRPAVRIGSPKCEKCEKSVYFNEERKAIGKSWHKSCFSCIQCDRKLDSVQFAEHDGEIFCKSCHTKNFGPTGYGFANGGAGLTGSYGEDIKPSKPQLTVPALIPKSTSDKRAFDACPRCTKAVYFAEEVRSHGQKYHKLCFKCGECSRPLQPGNLSEHKGDIYCKDCYGKSYGPKGYGFSGGCGQIMGAAEHPDFPRGSGKKPTEDWEFAEESHERWHYLPPHPFDGYYYHLATSSANRSFQQTPPALTTAGRKMPPSPLPSSLDPVRISHHQL